MPDIIIYGLPIATLVLSFLLYREIGKTRDMQTHAKVMSVLFQWMCNVGTYRLTTDSTFLTTSNKRLAMYLYIALSRSADFEIHPDIDTGEVTTEQDVVILNMYLEAKETNSILVNSVANWDAVFHKQLEETLLNHTTR